MAEYLLLGHIPPDWKEFKNTWLFKVSRTNFPGGIMPLAKGDARAVIAAACAAPCGVLLVDLDEVPAIEVVGRKIRAIPTRRKKHGCDPPYQQQDSPGLAPL